MVTYMNVSVKADGADTQQGTEARGEADAGYSLTQIRVFFKPLFSCYHSCKQQKTWL